MPIKIGDSVRVRDVAPKLGQDNAEIIGRLGVSKAEMLWRREERRAVNLCRVAAGAITRRARRGVLVLVPGQRHAGHPRRSGARGKPFSSYSVTGNRVLP